MPPYADWSPYPELERAHLDALRQTFAAVAKQQGLTQEVLRHRVSRDLEFRRIVDDFCLLRQTQNNRLRPSVLGLLHLEAEGSGELLDVLAKIVDFARSHYDPERHDVPESELRAETKLSHQQLDLVRPYLEDLWGLALTGDSERRLTIAESVVDYASLRDAIEKSPTFRAAYHQHARHELPKVDPQLLDVRLRALRVSRFRVLRELRLELGPELTVLVGPNRSGKSTVLDAVSFVGVAILEGLENAVESENGVARLRTAGTEDAIELVCELDIDLGGGKPDRGEYGFAITPRDGRPDVTREWLTTTRQGDERRWVDAHKAVVERLDSKGTPVSATYKGLASLALSDDQVSDVARGVRSTLGLSVLVDRDPFRKESLHDQPVVYEQPRTDGRERSSTDVMTILETVASRPRLLARLSETLHELAPDVARVEAVTRTGAAPELRVVERYVPRPLGVDEISAGTRQLMLLAALYAMDRPPPIILLEEPDAGMHPSALHALRDLMRELAQKTNVIATTHAPAFVKMLDPEKEVVALERDATEVRARPLAEALESRRWLAAFGATEEAFVLGAQEREP